MLNLLPQSAWCVLSSLWRGAITDKHKLLQGRSLVVGKIPATLGIPQIFSVMATEIAIVKKNYFSNLLQILFWIYILQKKNKIFRENI